MQSTIDVPVATAATPRNPQVVVFLETLKREQERYLDAIGCARATLPDQGSQLAQMSAVQGRLVRRLFDAQRAILEQRARVDDEFRAFLTGDVDGTRFERQLDALLDEWWQVERRATMASLDASTEELDDLSLDWAEPVPASPATALALRPLPSSLVDALATAENADLERVLEDLVADLDAHLAVAAASSSVLPPPLAGDLVILGFPDDDDERFASFWARPQTDDDVVVPEATDRSLAWIPTQVVLPIVAVTAGLSLALLLIG